jgi:two-component system NtrC family sensor kinase
VHIDEEVGVRELENRLEGLAGRGSRAEADALNGLGWALVPVDHRRAAELFERALDLSARLSYELGSARATFGRAFFDFFRADYGQALTKAHECAPVLREHGGPEDWANVLLLEGMVHWSLGDFELALDSLHRGYELSQECGYAYGDGWTLTSLGSIYVELGDFDKAVELQRRSIARFREARSLVGEGRATSGLGMVYLRQGKLDEALAVQRQSLALNRAGGSELSTARTLNDMGLVYEALGDPERAETCLQESLAIRERYENWPAVVTTLLALGKLYNDAARPEKAAAPLERAVELSVRMATRPKLWQAHAGLSRSYELRGAYREALEHQRLAQSIQEEVQGEEASTKLKNLQIRHEVETAEKEAELQRLRNVELAGALDELKRAQSHLVQSEKMAAVGRLVAGVVHELNNPVAALSCGMDVQARAAVKLRELVGESRGNDDGSIDRIVAALSSGAEAASAACSRIARLARSLQCFSQLDQSEFQRIDIHEGIEATIELARAQWGQRVAWVVQLGELPAIECYPGALNQAVMTLLVNAAESIEDTGMVTVTTEALEGHIRLSVSDTGRGIPGDRLESLFEIGFSEKQERVRMTTGLASVRATVEKHQGQISVSSVPGDGTRFVVELPLRQSA